MNNSFKEVQRVHCFNHTLQLSSKMLLKPFNAGLSGPTDDEPSTDHEDDELPSLVGIADKDNDDENGVDDEGCDCVEDDVEDEADELDALTDDECAQLLAETAVVQATVTKVCTALIASLSPS